MVVLIAFGIKGLHMFTSEVCSLACTKEVNQRCICMMCAFKSLFGAYAIYAFRLLIMHFASWVACLLVGGEVTLKLHGSIHYIG